MADWSGVRRVLRDVEDQRTFTWQELDSMVGGLPRSASEHSAFWKGARTGWPGFSTIDVRVGHSVTFVRRLGARRGTPPVRATTERSGTAGQRADVVLVGCVKGKRDVPAPARDLYTSALFRKERRYAETVGVPWFILSAQHGLVAPEEVLEPYELRLASTPRSYRQAWGARVVTQLTDALGPLGGKTFEVHASAAYSDPIRAGLTEAGAHIVEPLSGLRHGERLAWYDAAARASAGLQSGTRPRTGERSLPVPSATEVVDRLRHQATSQRPAEFLATKDPAMGLPGLYSWWVDDAGARDLSAGLGHIVEPGLIYAGLAGATRTRSGKASTNTLWGRIRGMHLGGRHEFSTFRRSLGSILAAARSQDVIDEARLTEWMHNHLRVIAIPVEDPDVLDALETQLLDSLDPPLNLSKRPKNELRTRLSDLRRQYGGR